MLSSIRDKSSDVFDELDLSPQRFRGMEGGGANHLEGEKTSTMTEDHFLSADTIIASHVPRGLHARKRKPSSAMTRHSQWVNQQSS